MLKKTLCIAVIFCAAFVQLGAAPEVIEIRKKAELNPSLYFSGVAGNPQLSSALRTFFGICGWFELTGNMEKCDYSVNGEISGNDLLIRVYQGKTMVAGWKFKLNNSPREVAKTVVDTVIERLFEQLKVRGFCRSRIAFTAETSPGVRNIFVCDIDGNGRSQVTAYRTMSVEPCWNHTGKTIFFSKYNRSGMDILETTLSTPRRTRLISGFRGINTGAAVSPDGSMLATILSPDHQVDLYLLGLNRKFRRRLTRGIAVEASPCWSPDGRQLAFVSDRHGSPRIFISDLTGNSQRKIPTVGSDAVTPAWSKDDKIAYSTRINGSYAIAVYDMKSGSNRRITKDGGHWESPDWAADNRQIVCKRTVGNKSALYVVDTKTGKARKLLQTDSKLFDPAWSPCRRK